MNPSGALEQRDTSSSIILEARRIQKLFHAGDEPVYALQDVSLCVARGEFVAVLGPSGAGKSTLLNILGGLDPPSAGNIIVEGTDLFSLSEKDLTLFRRRRAGFIFQTLNLLPTLTVWENVAIPYILDGRSSPSDVDRVQDLLELFGLRGRERRKGHELSAGEQQRVAVARAMLAQPA